MFHLPSPTAIKQNAEQTEHHKQKAMLTRCSPLVCTLAGSAIVTKKKEWRHRSLIKTRKKKMHWHVDERSKELISRGEIFKRI